MINDSDKQFDSLPPPNYAITFTDEILAATDAVMEEKSQNSIIPPEPSIDAYYGSHDKEEEEDDDDTKIMLQHWLNEKASPVLLPYADDTVHNILELLANQTALLEEQRIDTGNSTHVNYIYQMEIERIKFLLSSYLRCRLDKIEKFWLYWTNADRSSFSNAEEQYFQKLFRNRKQALDAAVYDHLPPQLGQLPVDEADAPNEDAHVICKVIKESVGEKIIDLGTMIPAVLIKDDIYIMKWMAAKPLLTKNQIQLL